MTRLAAELWTNWAGDQRCAPEQLARPGTERELAELVRRADRVRVAGSGHSFTDIACTDGLLLDLSAMSRLVAVDGPLVTVEAGITLRQLGEQLAARGLAMENQGDIDLQTLAGAISTATHGTGARFRNLSAQVAGLRMVSGTGELVELREGDDDLRAARVSLGALGAITQVTLRCVPSFTIHRIDEPRPLADTLERFDELAGAHDHFELFAFPYTRRAVVLLSERGQFEPRPRNPRREYVREVLLENRLLAAAFGLGRRAPALIPALNRALVRLAGREERTDASHRVYANRRHVRFTEMEYALPRDAGLEAFRRVMDTIERRRLRVGFPIELRVSAGDDAMLSTAHGRDTAYVAVHQYRGMEFEAYFRAVERIMEDYGGRPHWGKRHYRSVADLRGLYPEWDRFQRVRARLDPDGRFQNDYVERVLGPSGAP